MRGRCWWHSMNQSDDEAVSTSPPLAFKFWMCGFFYVCVLSNFVLYTPQSVQCKEIKYGFCGCCWNSIWNFHSQASFRSVDGWMNAVAASNLSLNGFYWIYSPNPLKIPNIWNVQMTWSIQSDARWHSCIFTAKYLGILFITCLIFNSVGNK